MGKTNYEQIKQVSKRSKAYCSFAEMDGEKRLIKHDAYSTVLYVEFLRILTRGSPAFCVRVICDRREKTPVGSQYVC